MDGAKLFAGQCDFVLGVAALSQLPDMSLPEIALAGRSNVGKSSLVNALTGRRTLAKTSHTPGRTQQLNYFNLGDRLYLVDMPGYGYAQVSKQQKKEWNVLIREYLRGRASLRCVLILVDSRHGLKEHDREMMNMLDECAAPYRIILTKTDKVKTQELEVLMASLQQDLKKQAAGYPMPHPTSTVNKNGIEELRDIIVAYAY